MALLGLGSSSAVAQVSISINLAPPALQVDTQPVCPDDGYIWTPGYWAYGDSGYYWVAGAWIQPPETGEYWTPPYWAWNGNAFEFYPGYWGQDVGYYGGINYGYGYGGNGYRGGRWQEGHFSYNTAVNNVGSAHVHSSYADRTAIANNASRVSYNGGKGGVQAQPTAKERQDSSQRHPQPATAQPAPVKSPSPAQPNGTGASFTGEPATHPAKPQAQVVNPTPEANFHPQPPMQPKTDPQVQQPEHQQQPPPPQPQVHQQAPAQPKQDPRPEPQATQPTHDKAPSAPPNQKPDNSANNAPNH